MSTSHSDAALSDQQSEGGPLACSLTSWNMGGGWGPDAALSASNSGPREAVWDWLYRKSGMCTLGGGIVCLQDTRITYEDCHDPANQWWRYRGDATAIDPQGDLPTVQWALAPSPRVQIAPPAQLGLKPMGGVFIMAWGDVGRHAFPLGGEDRDKYGRWVAMKFKGENGRYTVVVSLYRPPGGLKEGGGLVARMAHLRRGERGWSASQPWSRLTARAATSFYQELGDRIRSWRSQNMAVILCGDFNETIEPGSRLHGWSVEFDLLDTFTLCAAQHSSASARGEAHTYMSSKGGGRRIDHILMLGAKVSSPTPEQEPMGP